MLRKDQLKPQAATADPAEIARFDAVAAEWWNPHGAFKPVHAFNAARVAWLAEGLPRLLGRDPAAASPLAGLSLADIGCGAGLVAEPMARLGATVTGIDAAARNIAIARSHARTAGLTMEYRHALPEDLVFEQRSFDIVLSLEVVEHVADLEMFLAALARLVAPGGLLVIGTLNRTPASFLKAIVGAEYVLRWLPRGTHDWRRFVTPGELQHSLAPKGLAFVERCGVELSPLGMRWQITRSAAVNYMQIHRRS